MASFRVAWQFIGAKAMSRANYEAHDLPTLMRLLAKSEGVAVATCDKLFVHYNALDGKVIEVVSHETDKGTLIDSSQTYKEAPSNVVSIKKRLKEERAKKPHIRLKVPEETVPVVYGGLGLYKALEAR